MSKHSKERGSLTDERCSAVSSSKSGLTCETTRQIQPLNTGRCIKHLIIRQHLPEPSSQRRWLIKTGGEIVGLDTHLTHLCSQITPCGQVFEPEQTVPVSCTSPTWVMMDHLTMEKHRKNKARVLSQAGKKLHY